jgi:hypothetical protein
MQHSAVPSATAELPPLPHNQAPSINFSSMSSANAFEINHNVRVGVGKPAYRLPYPGHLMPSVKNGKVGRFPVPLEFEEKKQSTLVLYIYIYLPPV